MELHAEGWNGIWCSVLADRFAAGAIPPSTFICGNPPWVKWSHLPPEYASFIKPRCLEMGVFSEDRWVGGIESDISTVITYEAIEKYLSPGGTLGFFITGSVFTNESSAGFRKFSLHGGRLTCKVVLVEDYQEIAPFEGVTNHPTFLMLRRGGRTKYPVPYRRWRKTPGAPGTFVTGEEFRATAAHDDLIAMPVPGGDERPWLRGTRDQQRVWATVFAQGDQQYVARKGVTTDRNGIYWVRIHGARDGLIEVENQADIGRTTGIPRRRAWIERRYLYPLIRGRQLSPFHISGEELYIIVPQGGMHGDPDLPVNAPRTHGFLSQFRSVLEQRSSYRRFQRGKPYWSTWSTGPYTFSPFKVLWKEMSGTRFQAAYVGSVKDQHLGSKVIVPDHKLYFIPVKTEAEAAYLTAILNARTIADAVAGYAAQLSLGGSISEYLHLPKFDVRDSDHVRLSKIGVRVTRRTGELVESESADIEKLTMTIIAASIKRKADVLRQGTSRIQGNVPAIPLPFHRVEPLDSEKYAICIPLLTLKAAAGLFGAGQDVEPEAWVVPNTTRRLRKGMFVAQVVGKSMEPEIPDASYCLFAGPVEGSRTGRVVLAQHRSIADPETGGQYTVKRYETPTAARKEGTVRAGEIRLKPRNPGFAPIVLQGIDEQDVAVIAEVVEVLGAS